MQSTNCQSCPQSFQIFQKQPEYSTYRSDDNARQNGQERKRSETTRRLARARL